MLYLETMISQEAVIAEVTISCIATPSHDQVADQMRVEASPNAKAITLILGEASRHEEKP